MSFRAFLCRNPEAEPEADSSINKNEPSRRNIMKKKKIYQTLSVLLGLSIVVAFSGCASESKNNGTTPAVPVSAETSTAAGAAAKSGGIIENPVEYNESKNSDDSNERPRYGGKITIAYASEQNGSDPALYNFGGMHSVHHTEQTMLEADWSKGPAGTNEAMFEDSTPMLSVNKGQLIDSYEFVNDDTIIFHVKQGVHYSLNPDNEASALVGGRELVAEDIAYSIRRAFDMQDGVSVPNAYSLARMSQPEWPTSVEATDTYTLEVKGNPEYLGSLFYWITEMIGIYPPEIIETYGDITDIFHDVGTGPFYVTEFVQNSYSRFQRNDSFHDTNPIGPGEGDQLPYVDTLEIQIIPDLSTRLAAFRTGQLDQIMNITYDDFKQLLDENPNLNYQAIPGLSNGLALRSDRPDLPWYKKEVRQALFLSVDRESIINSYYKGAAINLAYPVPPLKIYKTMGSYTEIEDLPEETKALFEYNPKRAKELLAEAGYPDGFTINVVVNASSQSDIDELSLLSQYFSAIGVTINMDQKEDSVFKSISAARSYDEAIYVESLSSAYQAFHNFRPTDPANTALIDDETVNEMISEFNTNFMVNDEVAWPSVQKYTPYILDQCWYIFLPAPYKYTIWQPWLKNYNGEYGLGGGHFFEWTRYAWVDEELKKSLGY